MYEIEYLPIAKQDMVDIAIYISQELCNPEAAEVLALEMIEAGARLAAFPYINLIHFTARPLKREYRKQMIKNYIMFYWIDEYAKKAVIARVIYARRDYGRLL
ncbi:MAG: type II toxin-antitoxin system RelE/ParE family toxin [Defluviitaleaceae bacterium]|nr:type II toxin-antitoxin system RelE/ParE family toxin [Defluviitaleaceae bacterium]